MQRQRKDAEGELFAQILKQAGRGPNGYAQGVYLFTPAGKLLAFSNTADAAQVKGLLETALKKFDPSVSVANVEENKPALVLPQPPAGGLIVDVTAKVLGGYEANDKASQHHLKSLGRDHLWLRADEAALLAKGELADSVKKRIARFHLVDNTRGEPPMWAPEEIKQLELNLHEGRLAGLIHLETKSGDRGYKAELQGIVVVKAGQVTQFDLLAKGQYWGEGTFTRGAPKGRYPFAVAFSLTDTQCAASKVPPQGSRGNLTGYLK
jgi:hypothetical protein